MNGMVEGQKSNLTHAWLQGRGFESRFCYKFECEICVRSFANTPHELLFKNRENNF